MATRTPGEKAAILLSRLPADLAERILAELGAVRRQRLRPELEKLRKQEETPDDLSDIIREFRDLLHRPAPLTPTPLPPQGGEGQGVRGEKLAAYQPPAEVEITLPEEQGLPTLPSDPVRALDSMPPNLLAAVLQGEQANTVSLVLNCVGSEKAGEVLRQLKPEMRCEVSVRLSRLTSSPPELLARIARALVQKSRTLAGKRSETGGDARYKRMADIFRCLEKAERQEVLAALEENDPETAARIKELLYQFEDLLRIHDRSMQKMLSEIDAKTLSMALKGASEDITAKVMNNLSKRARETLSEEMEFQGMIPIAQVRQAQKLVVDVIQRLDQAGELMMVE